MTSMIPTVDPKTIKALQTVEAKYRKAAAEAEQLRGKRNDAVRAALAAGESQAAIGEATGLTRGRINQLRSAPSERKDRPA